MRRATLSVIVKYLYDTHLLKLSYTCEDDSKEYYCLIYEEEIDQLHHWFYYCAKRKFTAHPWCIIRENSCIKFGRTCIEKNHQHPLTIVEKTKYSSPCNGCGKSFINVALECTLCKFTVHLWYNCLKEASNRMK